MLPATDSRLGEYGRKRNFGLTPEPPPGLAKGQGHVFVIQRHWARREHFDLRLEIDGTMKSWAVTKGPSNDPADRRLAVRVEDHPLEYAKFEGVIPKPQYGGGTVMIWDRGTWSLVEGDAGAGLRKGKLKLDFQGTRMRGIYNLVRMKTNGESRENWLLIKERDRFARTPASLVAKRQKSVATGRGREEIENAAAAPGRQPAELPGFISPMLCRIRDEPPEGREWLHEIKYDGYRLQIAKDKSAVAIRTREGLNWTAKFGAIADAARALREERFIIDGEAVVFDANGISDFALLQEALKRGAGNISFVAFDILLRDKEDLRNLPLLQRKRALRALIGKRQGAIRVSQHVLGNGHAALGRAAQAGAEGIISKKSSSLYRSVRSHDWLKIKFGKRDDVAIVGYVPSKKGRKFGALVTAFGEKGSLRLAGRVGTGFGSKEMDSIYRQLAALRRTTPPPGLEDPELAPRGTIWVEPALGAEVAMTGLTPGSQLRHPRFLALRNRLPEQEKKEPVQNRPSKPSAAPGITHADRIVFPDAKVSKGDIAAYYAGIAPLILPHLKDRPVSFVRAPENIEAETFFQRHPLKGMTRGVKLVSDPEGRHNDYLVIADAEGLRTAAQFGVIEFHGWGSRLPRLHHPDRLVFDLDPGPDVDFAEAKAAALQLRAVIESVDLRCFPLLSGGKGIHVVVPLDRNRTWDEVEVFAKGLAKGFATTSPGDFVATASKELRIGKIYIDWLRNKMTATAIVPWSLRARKEASIAVPVSWSALKKAKSAHEYSIRSSGLKEGWPEFFSVRQSIASKTLGMLKEYA